MIVFANTAIVSIWIFVLGAAIGSFVNVLIYRLPLGFSPSLPSRSACRGCKRKLRWFENIPILSYLFLRARCPECHGKISFRYPLVELMTATLFVAALKRFGFSFDFAYYAIFLGSLVTATFTDLDHRIIPDEISIGGTALGIAISGLVEGHGYSQSALGALLGGGGFWLLAWTYEKATKREGLGFGDVKLIAMIGAFLGVKGVLLTIVLSSTLGSVIGLILMFAHKKDLKFAIPFGPFLALGALIALFWGDYLTLRFYPYT